MGKHFRIRVHGKPRKHLDPDLLAQVVILYGRQLARQRQQQAEQQQTAGTPHDGGSGQSTEDISTMDGVGRSDGDSEAGGRDD